MTQYQYDTIVKIIVNGAPALSNELCEALAEVVSELNELRETVNDMGKIKSEKEEQ